MPSVTYPGVYVQEISSGVRPIEVASTSTAAFVGLTERGPDEATRVTSWTEFRADLWWFHPGRPPAASSPHLPSKRRTAVHTRAGHPLGRRDSQCDREQQSRHACPRPNVLGEEQGCLGKQPGPHHRRRHARPRQRVPRQRASAGRPERRAGEPTEHHAAGSLRQPEHRP